MQVLDALVALYETAIRQRRMWEQNGANRSGSEKALYNEQTDYFRNIENAYRRAFKYFTHTLKVAHV